jgi:Flp pilus assembly protein TadG
MSLFHAGDLIGRFRHDRHGSILLMFCFLLVGLFLLVGGAMDLSRAVMIRSDLQNAADAAALAGAANFYDASAFSTHQAIAAEYMNASIATLPDNGNITFTVSPFATDSNGTTTAYNVKVTASARVQTTFMSLVVDAIPVSVVATATNPVAASNSDYESNSFSASAPVNVPAADDPQLYERGRNLEVEAFGIGLAGVHVSE